MAFSHHIDFNPLLYQDILQLLIFPKPVCLNRRNQHRLDILALQYISQLVVDIIHLHTHQNPPFVKVVVGDKSFELKVGRLLVADILGQAHTALFYTIYQGAHTILRAKGDIKEILHQHPHGPHADGGYHIHGHNLPTCQHGKTYRETTLVKNDDIMHHQGKDTRQRHRLSHTPQIGKRRIADDARISMEEFESYQIENHVHTDGSRQDAEILQSDSPTIVEPKHEYARQVANQRIYYQHTPIRQCVACKIPIQQLCKDTHKSFINPIY